MILDRKLLVYLELSQFPGGDVRQKINLWIPMESYGKSACLVVNHRGTWAMFQMRLFSGISWGPKFHDENPSDLSYISQTSLSLGDLTLEHHNL